MVVGQALPQPVERRGQGRWVGRAGYLGMKLLGSQPQFEGFLAHLGGLAARCFECRPAAVEPLALPPQDPLPGGLPLADLPPPLAQTEPRFADLLGEVGLAPLELGLSLVKLLVPGVEQGRKLRGLGFDLDGTIDESPIDALARWRRLADARALPNGPRRRGVGDRVGRVDARARQYRNGHCPAARRGGCLGGRRVRCRVWRGGHVTTDPMGVGRAGATATNYRCPLSAVGCGKLSPSCP